MLLFLDLLFKFSLVFYKPSKKGANSLFSLRNKKKKNGNLKFINNTKKKKTMSINFVIKSQKTSNLIKKYVNL